MHTKIRHLRQLFRHFGSGWVLFRIGYVLRLRTGWMQRHAPAYEWAERPLEYWLRKEIPCTPSGYADWRRKHTPRFVFDYLPSLPEPPLWDVNSARLLADAVLEGRWRFFQSEEYNLGFPPDWHYNPESGQRLPEDAHWSRISDFPQMDIKYVWESSRFGCVFAFMRAYAATRDETYVAAFWHLIEHWAEHNPPGRGANWKCGQEASLRMMAWGFGLASFKDAASSTPERVAGLAAKVAAQADRVERNLSYAHSTRSNHGISEAMGLWYVGLFFPEFLRSTHWCQLGAEMLATEVESQFFTDGTYAMHSLNYHRFSLQVLLFALRLGEVNNNRLPQSVYMAMERSLTFLSAMVEPTTGQVPNIGSNDGALILPLNTCAFDDFRPLLQACTRLVYGERLYSPGPWDEDMLWLWGDLADLPQRTVPSLPQVFPEGGYTVLSDTNSRLVIRCAHFTTRPSHADQLHVDFWWHGQNIIVDAGTYRYHGGRIRDNALAHTDVHNTVTVDGQSQMRRASRFTWVDWAQGRVTHNEQKDAVKYWQGEHDGYRRLSDPVSHQRAVMSLGQDCWLVLDRLTGQRPHIFRLHWLLASVPYTIVDHGLQLNTSPTSMMIRCGAFGNSEKQQEIVSAGQFTSRGWLSRYYGNKQPAISLSLTVNSTSALFWTTIGTCPS